VSVSDLPCPGARSSCRAHAKSAPFAGIAACLFLLAPATSRAQATLTRGPSIWSTTDRSFLVAFQTSQSAVGSVEWGTTPQLANFKAGTSTTDHVLRLDGLEPDRFYYYRVRVDGTPVTPVHRTRTFAGPARSDLSFSVCGDSGTGGPEQFQVADLLGRWTFHLGLMPGDVVYDHGERENFDPNFFQPYRQILARRPMFPVLGNHEIETENGAPYFEAFHLPSANSGTERWYSFDAGAVHFVGLDSTDPMSVAQLTWLRRDLADARQRGVHWIFVQFHHPPYTSGTLNGSELRVRSAFCPILEEFEVDAVFTGHEHNYERTVPIRQYYPFRRGVVYYVVGTGGYPGLYDLGARQPYSAFSARTHGFLKVEVRGDLMHTEFIDASAPNFGGKIDSHEIRRGPVYQGLVATSENPRIGMVLRFELRAPSGTRYVVAATTKPGYLATPFGIYHLVAGSEVVLTNGTMSADRLPLQMTVPADNALRGIDVLVQSVTQRSTGPLVVTNLLESIVR
jgi:hypothetical protein